MCVYMRDNKSSLTYENEKSINAAFEMRAERFKYANWNHTDGAFGLILNWVEHNRQRRVNTLLIPFRTFKCLEVEIGMLCKYLFKQRVLLLDEDVLLENSRPLDIDSSECYLLNANSALEKSDFAFSISSFPSSPFCVWIFLDSF